MKSTYAFDPYDWATITPLFEALIEAPIPDGGFMDWLAQWNQLDIAVWDAYTVLKRPAYYDTSNHVLHYYLDALTNCTLQDAFEHWVYGAAPADATPADLDAKWLELKARFTPWEECDPAGAEAQTGWQRWQWSLFRMPLYMITYPMAIVGVCQFGRLVEADRPSAIHNYKAALTLGNTRSLAELFRTVGITFPFTQQAVENTVQFIMEHLPGGDA